MPAKCHMIIVGNAIVTLGRRHRSKWWRIQCGCPRSRRRKDGSCKHERAVLSELTPEIAKRARIGGHKA